jgi:hypothetical protein
MAFIVENRIVCLKGIKPQHPVPSLGVTSYMNTHCQNSRSRQPTIAIQTVNNTRRPVLRF